MTGETPKQFTLRLRLGRAAAMLLTRDDSVLDIALTCGFQSHEVFSRAFRRRFGTTPRAYRQRGFAGTVSAAQQAGHAEMVDRSEPLHGAVPDRGEGKIAEERHGVFDHEEGAGAAAGAGGAAAREAVRDRGHHRGGAAGHFRVRTAARNRAGGAAVHSLRGGGGGLAHDRAGDANRRSGHIHTNAGDILADTLPAGPAATTIHSGPYEQLPDAYGALEQWIEAEGLTAAGAPWEAYLNDPSDHPDPQDWKTEIFWPVSI